MIEAICDKCGKNVVLKYCEYGLKSPEGWRIESQYFPKDREVAYRTFCPECYHNMKEVKE